MAEPRRYAIVSGDLVVNIILWDGEATWSPPEGTEAVQSPDEIGMGWTYAGGVWTAPAEETEA